MPLGVEQDRAPERGLEQTIGELATETYREQPEKSG